MHVFDWHICLVLWWWEWWLLCIFSWDCYCVWLESERSLTVDPGFRSPKPHEGLYGRTGRLSFLGGQSRRYNHEMATFATLSQSNDCRTLLCFCERVVSPNGWSTGMILNLGPENCILKIVWACYSSYKAWQLVCVVHLILNYLKLFFKPSREFPEGEQWTYVMLTPTLLFFSLSGAARVDFDGLD